MKHFYLDKKTNKVYCFTPQARKEVGSISKEHASHLQNGMVRITKADAKKLAKSNTACPTVAALYELNMEHYTRSVKLGMQHSNQLQVPA